MNDPDGRITSEQSWKQSYEAALRESNPNLLQQRIAEAKKAIAERASVLLRENGHNHSEKEALVGANVVLDDLKRIYQTDGRVA